MMTLSHHALGRRSTLIGLCGLGTCLFGPRMPGRTAPAASEATLAAFSVPRGACDTHVHVVGPPAQFPMSPDRDYTPPPATVQDLVQMLDRLGLDRVTIVTPTIYGDDNSATLSAIGRIGLARARGVGILGLGTPASQCGSLAQRGIRGIRVLISGGERFDLAKQQRKLRHRIEFAEQQHWHLDLESPPQATAALAGSLAASPVPVVLDTFGWIGSTEQGGFREIRSLLESGKAYVKLSEPYRISKLGPDYPDLAPVARALVAANPERVLWGSGWPHVDSAAHRGRIAPNLPVDTGHLLRLLGQWVPDKEIRDKILVSNPAGLYGF